jgi:Gpi18-like mannosyltransferase
VDDLATFSHWAILAANNPWNQLYEITNASYPPGGMLFFELAGRGYRALVTHDPDQIALRMVLKLPAIFFDLIGSIVTYFLVRRFIAHRLALGAAALLILNPAFIYDSAYWGQIDSITSVCSLTAVWLMICGQRQAAWCVLAFAVLNKPPVIVLAPLFALEPFLADGAERWKRLRATAQGLVGALAVGYLVALPFYTDRSFVGVYWRLISSYQSFSALYPFNSINAFNLYPVFSDFYGSDTAPVLGISLKYWGYALFLVTFLVVAERYTRLRNATALLESSFLIMLGFFLFLTEMHERYLIYALTLALPLAVLDHRYLWAAGLLTLTLLLNLEYGLNHMWIELAKPGGMNIHEYAPVLVHLCSLANLGIFAICCCAYLQERCTEEPAESV